MWASYPFDIAPALDEQGRIPAMPYDPSPLPGSAPEYKAHIVLVPAQYARESMTWPSHMESVSPLFSELSSRAKKGGSLDGYAISLSEGDASLPEAQPAWDPHRDKAMRPPPSQVAEDEMYWLYAYNDQGKFVTWPEPISLRTLPSGPTLRTTLERMWKEAKDTKEAHIYVCTHGMRDCRCGVVGTELLHTLRDQVAQHADTCKQDNKAPAKQVRVMSVSHVGGHKWAANALVYPHGDWYGNLRTSDAPLLLRAALAPASSRHDLDDLRERLVLWPRWRGRLGLTQAEQREHMNEWGPPVVYTAHITPRARGGPSAAPSQVPLRFRSYAGEWFEVMGTIGESLMEVARRHDLPSIEATCGGSLECATCHAYICDAQKNDPMARGDLTQKPAKAEQLFGTTELSDDEDDMLEYAITRKPSSRLTCQVRVTQALSDWMMKEGGRVELNQY